MFSPFLALRALEVKCRALRRKLDVSGDRACQVVAGLTTLARLARAVREALAFSLHALDGVCRARLLVGDGVGSELDDANERLDGACFVDCLFECGG